jgi:hypothetical protein
MRDRWKPGPLVFASLAFYLACVVSRGPLVFASLAFYLARSCSYPDNESDSGWGRKGGGGRRGGGRNREEGDDGAGAVRAVVPKGRFRIWGEFVADGLEEVGVVRRWWHCLGRGRGQRG